ncbi:TrbG/VirB9 family P-type conjugative transfer protein [Rhizobium puerariae]|uniref:TrbG/VirB9 family P-type conjugative transfer protein n=1 Tax=Rhizobium puerariae TaxID=1585791 RepID=A0ABV6AQ95_9HYPH
MLKRIAITLLACVSIAAVAEAANPAPETRNDPRIRRYLYSENQVYKLDLYLKSVTAVQFADSEEVQSILIGDSASWEVVKLQSGNVVSIKPTIPSAATNMTIYTDKHVYAFELRSMNEYVAGGGEAPVFRSIFTYPQAARPKAAAAAPKAERVDSNYMVSGKAAFRPIWVQDNGSQTSFFLPENAPRPAILKVGPKRTEELVNSRTIGNRVVVDGTSDFWVLRIGDETVCIGRGGAVAARPSLFGAQKPSEVADVR